MSILNPVVPTCPTGCTSTLPTVSFSDCAPELGFGEIQSIFIGGSTVDPFNNPATPWTSLAAWTTAIGTTLVELVVSADLPAAAADELVISKGRKVYTPASHTINFDIDDVTASNYEFGRMTSCNSKYRIWFATPEYMFGGNDGILVNINVRPVIERGIKSLNKLMGTITWEAQFSPERAPSVFAV